MSSYVKSFNSFQKAEEKASQEVEVGSNPQMVAEDGPPSDPQLLTQYQQLQKEKDLQIQLNQQKATQDKRVADLQKLYDAAVTKSQAVQKAAAANQPATQPAQQPAAATPPVA